jgi:hypothetical protein
LAQADEGDVWFPRCFGDCECRCRRSFRERNLSTKNCAQRTEEKRLQGFVLNPSMCVGLAVFERVSDSTSAKEAWDNLYSAFSGTDKLKKVRLQTFRRQYENQNSSVRF